MKSTFLKAKSLCCFLALLLALQSCTVYKKSNISLAEAARTQDKVLVTTTTDPKLKLHWIEKKDSVYYGVTKIRGNWVNVPIKESDIVSIRPLDEKASRISTIVLILSPIVIGIVYAIASYDFDMAGFGEE